MLPGFNQVIVRSRSSFLFHCPTSFYSVSFTTIYLAILPALDIWVVSRFRCLYVYFYEHCCSEPPCTCLLGPRCTELGLGWLGQRRWNCSVSQDTVRAFSRGVRPTRTRQCVQLRRSTSSSAGQCRLLDFDQLNGHKQWCTVVFPKSSTLPSTFTVLLLPRGWRVPVCFSNCQTQPSMLDPKLAQGRPPPSAPNLSAGRLETSSSLPTPPQHTHFWAYEAFLSLPSSPGPIGSPSPLVTVAPSFIQVNVLMKTGQRLCQWQTGLLPHPQAI